VLRPVLTAPCGGCRAIGLAKLTDEVRLVLPANMMGNFINRILGVGEAGYDYHSCDPPEMA